MRGILRWLGTGLVAAAALALVWSFVVWQWQDPATYLYTTYEQHRLAGRLAASLRTAEPVAPTQRALAAAALRLRRTLEPGDPVGRLVVPRLGLSAVVVEGTDSASLRLGPGHDPRSYLPGEGNLVYIAGHRTTFAAPFARIDALRRGDVARLAMPYGTFTYVVTGHEIVDPDDERVLRPRRSEVLALQSCHPRFSAAHRYVVWARLREVRTTSGRIAYRQPRARAATHSGGDRAPGA